MFDSSCGSSAALSADKVHKACDKFLDARAKRIKEEREELIVQAMQGRKYFFGPKRDREEAIEYCKQDGFIPMWDEIAISGNYWANKIRDLQALAALADRGTINVDQEIAPILYQFWPNDNELTD